MVDMRREWLFPVCLRLVATDWPELELPKLPPHLKSQALYLELHWERVVRMLKRARYRRVKADTRRAEFLSAALADLKRAPSYAIDNYERESRLQKRRANFLSLK